MDKKRPKKRKPKISPSITGMAGVFFVSYQLSKKGMLVLPTNRNTKGFDIIAMDKDGQRLKLIQVKTQKKRSRYWPCGSPVPDFMGKDAFYIFTRPEEKGKEHYESFIVPANDVKKTIEERIEDYRQNPENREKNQILGFMDGSCPEIN
ncbi:MAG: hypothetical protein ACOC56_06690 [Atribacterota bacterium]